MADELSEAMANTKSGYDKQEAIIRARKSPASHRYTYLPRRPYNVQGRCEFVEEKGKIVDTIASYATNNKAGLLVMGAFGHNPIRELLFGSTTLDVLAKVTCPVLLMA